METTPELLCLSLVSRLSKKGPPLRIQNHEFEIWHCSVECWLWYGSEEVWVFVVCFSGCFLGCPYPHYSKISGWEAFLILCAEYLGPEPIPRVGANGRLGSYHPPCSCGGFCILCSAQSSYLSSSPDTGNLSERAGPSFLFSCLCEFIFYSSSAIFMGLEERSAIHACIQPGMFKGKTRWTDFPSPLPVHNTVSCCRKASQRDGEKRGEKGERRYLILFLLLCQTLTLCMVRHALQTKLNSQSQLYSYAAWRWHHWGALLGTITQLGEGFPCDGGKEWDYCLLNVSFCFWS